MPATARIDVTPPIPSAGELIRRLYPDQTSTREAKDLDDLLHTIANDKKGIEKAEKALETLWTRDQELVRRSVSLRGRWRVQALDADSIFQAERSHITKRHAPSNPGKPDEGPGRFNHLIPELEAGEIIPLQTDDPSLGSPIGAAARELARRNEELKRAVERNRQTVDEIDAQVARLRPAVDTLTAASRKAFEDVYARAESIPRAFRKERRMTRVKQWLFKGPLIATVLALTFTLGKLILTSATGAETRKVQVWSQSLAWMVVLIAGASALAQFFAGDRLKAWADGQAERAAAREAIAYYLRRAVVRKQIADYERSLGAVKQAADAGKKMTDTP